MPPIADVSAVGKIVSASTCGSDSLSVAAVPVNVRLRYLLSGCAKQNPERPAIFFSYPDSDPDVPIKLRNH